MPVVKVDHYFARTEYLPFAVDVKPVFDHTLEYCINSVFIWMSSSLLEDTREIIIPCFDHIVHVVVELEFFFGFHLVFLIIKLIVVLCI